jgi:ligand-binding sensor domain-containing protein
MWIGTQDGLNRYNAYNFEIYKREIKNSHSLSSNYISALAEDFQHTIWVGTVGGGLHQYDSKYNRFNRVQEIGQITVRFLFQDKSNTLWAGAGNSLYYFDNPTKKFVKYPVFTQWELTSILEYAPHELLIGTNGGGIFHLNLQSKEVKNHTYESSNPASLCHNSITSLYRDSQHNIWVGTEKGLDRFLPIQAIFEHFPLTQDKTKSLQVAPVKFIAGKGKEVWFATENGGLSILNTDKMLFQHYMPDANNPESINDWSIWTIYVDKQDRFWVGTFSGGANVLDGYWRKFDKPNLKLKNRTVNALLKDSKNRLWIGTEGGLTVQAGKEIAYYTHEATQPNSLGNNPVLAMDLFS